jgi:hypothetical protein
VGVVTLGLGLAGAASGCAGAFDRAWRTTDAVRLAGSTVDRALGAAAKEKHAVCVKQHGARTAGYAQCIDGHRKMLKAWREVARPAVSSALVATVSALQIAERVGQKEPGNWLELVKPAVCALAKVVEQWGHLMGADRERVLGLLALVKGVTCHG